MSAASVLDFSAIPDAQRAAVQALLEEVAALKDITRRQEHLIAELNHALHGKRSEKLSEDERQLAFEDLSIAMAEGFDAGIRIGNRLAQDMIAIRLTPAYRIAVVGSPSYIDGHGSPETPRDLSRHCCIAYRWAKTGQLARWSFTGPEGTIDVDVEGSVILNDTGLIRDLALSGLGLAYLPEAAVKPSLATGALIRVLDAWCRPFPGFYLYHPNRHQTPPGLRALITFLRDGERRQT